MATGSLGQLTIDLAANITRFERGLTRAENLAEKRSKAIKKTFTNLAVGIGGALASFGFLRAVQDSLQFADTIGKTADKLGIATDALQEYRFAAEQTGVDQRALDVGLQRFIRRTGEAAEGAGVLKTVFDELNIELRDSQGNMRDMDDILGDYANAIQNADSESRQLLLAFKAFDTEGAALVNLFRGGRDAVDEYRQELRDLGGILGEDVIRNSERANDAMNRLNKIIKVGSVTAFASLAPVIEDLADAITSLVKGDFQELPEIIRETIIEFEIIDHLIERTTLGLGAIGASAALLLSGEFSKIGEVWNETGEQVLASNAELDAFIEKVRTIDNLSEEITGGEDVGSVGKTTSDITKELSKERIEEINSELDFTEEILGMALKAHEKHAKDRIRLEQEVTASKKSLEASAVNNTLSLLSTLGRDSKGFALAALAVQKGLAIAETIMATNVAVMRAFEFYGPTPAGYAAAANMKALGALNVGLIAATGLAQAGQIGGGGGGGTGGAGLGTPSNPVTTTDTPLPFESGNVGGGTITFVINGVVTEEILNDLMIPAIQDAVNNKDVILINGDSRNALELTS